VLRAWIAIQSAATSSDIAGIASLWEAHVRRAVILRLDVVMYGVLGALLAARQPELWRRMTQLWPLGLLLVGAGATSIALDFPLNRGRLADGLLLWPCLAVGSALLLPYLSFLPEKSGWLAEAARLVARLSYALYLCHGLVLLIFTKFLSHHSLWPSAKHTLPWCLAVWAASFGVAWVVYHWFEKPIMDLRERTKQRANIAGANVSR
jgi:peptidoglycan/LPS O-acetylase OafA/YrhL